MKSSTHNFVVFLVAVHLLFAGALGWFAFFDKDYGYAHQTSADQYPDHADGRMDYYDQLTDRERDIVDRALDGEKLHFEESEDAPRQIIKQGDTYHQFNKYGYFDFLDPGTLVPTVLELTGLGLMVLTARRDIR